MRIALVAAILAISTPALAQTKLAQSDLQVRLPGRSPIIPAAATSAGAPFPPCLPIDVRPECHGQAKSITSQTLGPCLSIFNAIDPENFTTQVEACIKDDVQAVIDNANTEPKDNVALSCWVPVQAIVAAAGTGKGGVLLAFQLFRRAKQQGIIANCTAYLQTTLMLQ
jgi:hypothetical protein